MAQNNVMKWQYGYSMIELMVVVSIIGIVVAVALPSYQSSIALAAKYETISYLLTLQVKQEHYWLSEGTYADVSQFPMPSIEGVTLSQVSKANGNYTISATMAFLDEANPCRVLTITPVLNLPEGCWSY